MKTLLTIILLNLLNLNAIPVSAGTSGSLIGDEAYVNDFPINTSAVFSSYMVKMKLMKNASGLPDEAYVDDVPFNTSEVCQALESKHGGEKLPSFLRDETNVEDPVNTEAIAGSYLASQKARNLQLKPEPYVNDFPLTLVPVNITTDKSNPDNTQYIVNLNLEEDVELVSVQRQGNQVKIILCN